MKLPEDGCWLPVAELVVVFPPSPFSALTILSVYLVLYSVFKAIAMKGFLFLVPKREQ